MHQRRDAKAVETAAGDSRNVNFNSVSESRQCGRWVSVGNAGFSQDANNKHSARRSY